jgi:hybrid cluster-associated redox disulfide protein
MGRLLDHDMTMDEIMRRWPETIRGVIHNGMLCVGCPIAPFHTVAEAAREHGLDEAALRRALEAAVSYEAGSRAAMSSRPALRPA